MNSVSQAPARISVILYLFVMVALFAAFALPAHAQFTLQKISIDQFTNSDSVHRTEVEPATFASGSTIVSAFQVARRPGNIGWGSADIGFATSTNGGITWSFGYLPGLTVNYKNGPYYGAADPSVAYDSKHGVWLISSLPLINPIGDVAVSRSNDGLHWSNPVIIDSTHNDDKNWTVCDNTPSSPYFGNCYTEWDAATSTGFVEMSTSRDGGKTWTPGATTADHAGGLGGQPLVQPNGNVVVPFTNYFGNYSFTSTDGGKTWGQTVTIVAAIDSHADAGGIRNPNLPSAEIDSAGKLYVLWADCRFRKNCAENDVVMSTSADGNSWSKPVRIPIDPTTSTVDHFIPGIGIDHSTGGSGAHITIVYYYYPVSSCGNSCQLDVGFTTSQDGGQTWTAGQKIAGPMQLSWLPVSDLGPMVADYIHVSYTNGNPFGVFAAATAPNGGVLNEAMYTTKQPLLALGDVPRFSSKSDEMVAGAKSDHVMKGYYDDEGRYPIPESKRDQGKSQE
ncbi:MAG TPA: sialidase family protein [Terriglobales bacterium]|nr:sialidase family protein [Terriglobales bacterium]